MRIITLLGLVLTTIVIHGCGAGGDGEPKATEATPETAPSAMAAPEAIPETGALDHAVDPATLALNVDPVCKMSFEEYAVQSSAEHGGKNYGFCSEFCKKNFAKDPDKILERVADTAPGGDEAP